MNLRFNGNWSAKTLHEMSDGLKEAARILQVRGWCRESLRKDSELEYNVASGRYEWGPSRVCMMGAIQEAMAKLPSRVRFTAYDFVHQALDGVLIQDFNDAQSNPKPVIRKLLRVASLIEDKAMEVEARQKEDS